MVPSLRFLALQSRTYSAKPSAKVFSLGKHILIFFIKNTPKNAKIGSTSLLFWRVGCASLFHFCEKWGLNFSTPKIRFLPYFFRDSSTATATETVMPTMGLLPWSLGRNDVLLSVSIRPNMSSQEGDSPNGKSVSISIRLNFSYMVFCKMWMHRGLFHMIA